MKALGLATAIGYLALLLLVAPFALGGGQGYARRVLAQPARFGPDAVLGTLEGAAWNDVLRLLRDSAFLHGLPADHPLRRRLLDLLREKTDEASTPEALRELEQLYPRHPLQEAFLEFAAPASRQALLRERPWPATIGPSDVLGRIDASFVPPPEVARNALRSILQNLQNPAVWIRVDGLGAARSAEAARLLAAAGRGARGWTDLARDPGWAAAAVPALIASREEGQAALDLLLADHASLKTALLQASRALPDAVSVALVRSLIQARLKPAFRNADLLDLALDAVEGALTPAVFEACGPLMRMDGDRRLLRAAARRPELHAAFFAHVDTLDKNERAELGGRLAQRSLSDAESLVARELALRQLEAGLVDSSVMKLLDLTQEETRRRVAAGLIQNPRLLRWLPLDEAPAAARSDLMHRMLLELRPDATTGGVYFHRDDWARSLERVTEPAHAEALLARWAESSPANLALLKDYLTRRRDQAAVTRLWADARAKLIERFPDLRDVRPATAAGFGFGGGRRTPASLFEEWQALPPSDVAGLVEIAKRLDSLGRPFDGVSGELAASFLGNTRLDDAHFRPLLAKFLEKDVADPATLASIARARSVAGDAAGLALAYVVEGPTPAERVRRLNVAIGGEVSGRDAKLPADVPRSPADVQRRYAAALLAKLAEVARNESRVPLDAQNIGTGLKRRGVPAEIQEDLIRCFAAVPAAQAKLRWDLLAAVAILGDERSTTFLVENLAVGRPKGPYWHGSIRAKLKALTGMDPQETPLEAFDQWLKNNRSSLKDQIR